MADEIKPYRLQINFTGAHKDFRTIEEIYDAIVEDAEHRGVFFEFGHIGEMDLEDVIPNSPLDKVLTGDTGEGRQL